MQTKTLTNEFSSRILRSRAGKTQATFGKTLGISQVKVSNLENGKIFRHVQIHLPLTFLPEFDLWLDSQPESMLNELEPFLKEALALMTSSQKLLSDFEALIQRSQARD